MPPLTLSLHTFPIAGFLLQQGRAKKHYPVVEFPQIKVTPLMKSLMTYSTFFFFNRLMQCEPQMPVEERKPQPTRNLDFCKTRQGGQDPGSDLESRNAEALPS